LVTGHCDLTSGKRSISAFQRFSVSGFTLIELLVVVTIIIILMGLLFPVFRGVQDQAKKVQAKNDATQIVTAVNAYYTDYGTYPLNSKNNGGGSDTVYGDPGGTYTSADLFNILRAIPDGSYNTNNQLNSRQVVYFNGPNAKDPINPRSGFFTGTSAITNSNGYSIKPGSYVDPWGDEYAVFIDADYSGDITQSLGWFYTDYSGSTTNVVRYGAGAVSLGKDGKWGTNGDHKFTGSDDIGSWQ
jgi:type II secretory pathway pseudopilin PulG